jgi:hypothetical protein
MILYLHSVSRAMATTVGIDSVFRSRARAARVLHGVVRDLFDPYRPELHYMRGPGPRWREKNATQYVE